MVKQLQSADRQMDHFTREDLTRLLAQRQGPCISFFMPMERRGIITKGNPIRLKNMLDQAEERLRRLGMKDTEIGELLAPAGAKLTDTWFWQHQCRGLAIFIARGEFYLWRLPLDFEEMVEVGEQFITRPLIPLLTGDGVFYVLALAKGGARLMECVRYTFGEIEITGVPTSLPMELRYDIFDLSEQHHAASIEGGGMHWGAWHGHGAPSDGALLKERVMGFCKHLDDGVCEALAGDRAPLVLAGVEYLRGFYREASHYSHVVEEGINASPELMRDEELHRRAWSIVEPIFRQERDTAMDLYHQLAGSDKGRVGKTLEAVVPAAIYKRVETLFIAKNARVWGKYNQDTQEVTMHQDWDPGDMDLIDLAVSHTLRNHGTVYCEAVEAMPGSALVAAIFRF